MMRLKSMTIVAAAALAFSAGAAVPTGDDTAIQSTPISEGGIIPYIIFPTLTGSADQGGNRTCEQVNTAFETTFDQSTERLDNPGVPSFTVGEKFWVEYDAETKTLKWSSTLKLGAVIVKGSNDANVYVYDGWNTDLGLGAPATGGGTDAGLSNITFCWDSTAQDEPSEWCSPGYWRQPHHLGNWPVSTETTYFSVFSAYPPLSRSGQRLGASSDETTTLLFILGNPNLYGGETTNQIADYLSGESDLVDFTGERVEDSCPLGRPAE